MSLDKMKQFLKYGENKGASYVELKSNNDNSNYVELKNHEVKEVSISEAGYYSAKVLYKNKLGMAYSNKPEFKKIIDSAIKCAKMNDRKINLEKMQCYKNKIKTPYKKSLNDLSLEYRKKYLMNLSKTMDEYKKISSLKLIQSDSIGKYNLVNSYGTELEWEDSFIKFLAWAFAKEGNRQENYVDVKRKHSGYELMEESEKITKNVLEYSEKLLKAKAVKGGNFPVILDQKLGGVFTHEAIGHATEADAVLNEETVLKDKMNKMIASSKVNISDDGTLMTNGWIPFDDDGIKTKKNILIKNGELKGYLHSLQTASIMGVEPTGNGRSQDIVNNVIPRMTTTFMEEGDSNFDEMLKTIKEGYYLVGSLGGEVDTAKGEFLFNAKHGYRIINGEIKELVKGVSLTGNILEIMPKINLIGKDIEFGNGMCGKCGQSVPVSEGAPHFKIDIARVGGEE